MRRSPWLVVVLLAGVLAAGAGVPAVAAEVAPAGRLGLHVTAAELAEWRTRASSGPYRSAGDVSTNSPGDWDRISARAATFAADPDANRWAGPSDVSGCVDGSGATTYDPKDANSRHLRDAAFAALVTRDAGLRRAAAAELYAQSQVAGLDFSDRSRWCLETIWDLNPGFEIANFLTSLLYAFEYIEIGDREAGTDSLTAVQEQAILDWMYAASEWMNHDVNTALAKNFSDRHLRSEPPYALSSNRAANPVVNAAPYDGTGDVIGAIARYYNNRRAQQQRFVGLLGLHLTTRADGYRPPVGSLGFTAETLVADAGRFAKDYLVYSVYPQGFTGEFHRWTATLPDLGWGYAIAAAAPVMTYIDAAARAGDTTLYEYTTSAGAHNTAGTPVGQSGKNYRWLVSELLGYQDGTHDRYIPGHAGQSGYRIDGVHRASGWDAAHEAVFAPALRHWGDTYHQSVIDRTAPGSRTYPVKPAGFGQYLPWTGDWGTLPAPLFMASRMDHVPSPTRGTTRDTGGGTTPGTTDDGDGDAPAVDDTPTRLADELLAAACDAVVTTSPFADVAGNVHRTAIECMAGLGIAQGTGATTFSPTATVTRGQMATFLTRVVEKRTGQTLPAASTSFLDIAGSVHATAIERLAGTGIVAGVSANRFAPDAAVTRAQMATFLVRTASHLGVEVAAPVSDAFSDDAGSVHEPAIDVATAAGLVTGTRAGVFAPAKEVRRDQMASFLARLVGWTTSGTSQDA